MNLFECFVHLGYKLKEWNGITWTAINLFWFRSSISFNELEYKLNCLFLFSFSYQLRKWLDINCFNLQWPNTEITCDCTVHGHSSNIPISMMKIVVWSSNSNHKDNVKISFAQQLSNSTPNIKWKMTHPNDDAKSADNFVKKVSHFRRIFPQVWKSHLRYT